MLTGLEIHKIYNKYDLVFAFGGHAGKAQFVSYYEVAGEELCGT